MAAFPSRDMVESTCIAPPASVRLNLLEGFELAGDGEPISLPFSAQRVLALLALQERPHLRLHVAMVLWPDTPEREASASLRSALWRLRQPAHTTVQVTRSRLRIAIDVSVDVWEMYAATQTALDPAATVDRATLETIAWRGELLPGWYDDWVVTERERLRQLRLHALEGMAEQLVQRGAYALAVEAGIAAVAEEPLRESAHRALIRAHLAEGNVAEAVRQYRDFHQLLQCELGVAPSSKMEELLAGVLSQ